MIDPQPSRPPIRCVAVIGGGTIGTSWAACFLAHGLTVKVHEPEPDREAEIRGFIEAAWPSLVQLHAAPPEPPFDRLSCHQELTVALEGADLVQECAPEIQALKIELFRELDRLLDPDVIVSTSTSSLLISELQEGCRHPERFVVGHPYNPPHLIPAVDVVGGQQTTAQTLERVLTFYSGIGKRPVVALREAPGHVANRLTSALWREAVHLVDSGIATAADVDTAVTYGPGLRWAFCGPYLGYHLGGGQGGLRHFLDWATSCHEARWQTLGSPDLSNPRLQEKLIEQLDSIVGDATTEELAGWRDRSMVKVLRAVQECRSDLAQLCGNGFVKDRTAGTGITDDGVADNRVTEEGAMTAFSSAAESAPAASTDGAPGSIPPRDTQSKPEPLPPQAWSEILQSVRHDLGEPANIHGVMAHHPELLSSWMGFRNHLLRRATLSDRLRELLILRTASAFGADYEWHHHVVRGKQAGLSDEDIDGARDPASATSLAPEEVELMRAVDEIRRDFRIGDETWSRLAAHFSTQQLLDVMFTVGMYIVLAIVIRSVDLEFDAQLPNTV